MARPRLTNEIVISRTEKDRPGRFGFSKINVVNSKTKIILDCLVCGDEIKITPNALDQGQGCMTCGHVTTTEKKRGSKEQLITAASLIYEKDHYGYDRVVYKNNHTKVEILCHKHQEYFFITPKNHMHGHGCPRCNRSKGQIMVAGMITNSNMPFEENKGFPECKNINELPFDFWIPSRNLLIEYDGIQHYEPLEFFGGEEGFAYRQRNDAIKTKFATENYNFLRIPYWLKKEEVERIISLALFGEE